jgi:starvation-inducible DNA-binding protein
MSTPIDLTTAYGQIVSGLQQAVANTYSLTALTHNVHWNLTGSDFFQVHSELNDEYNALFDKIDLFAERIRQLKSFVKVNLSLFQTQAGFPELAAPFDIKSGIQALVDAHNKNIVDLTNLSELCGKLNDLATQQIVLDAVLDEQKLLWKLTSYLG